MMIYHHIIIINIVMITAAGLNSSSWERNPFTYRRRWWLPLDDGASANSGPDRRTFTALHRGTPQSSLPVIGYCIWNFSSDDSFISLTFLTLLPMTASSAYSTTTGYCHCSCLSLRRFGANGTFRRVCFEGWFSFDDSKRKQWQVQY